MRNKCNRKQERVEVGSCGQPSKENLRPELLQNGRDFHRQSEKCEKVRRYEVVLKGMKGENPRSA